MEKLISVILVLFFSVSMAAVKSFGQEINFQMPDKDPGGTIDIIGGDPVSSKIWPATRIFRSDTSSCTATIVGEQVVLVAAHCLSNRAKVRLPVKDRSYTLICDHHPDYKLRSDNVIDFFTTLDLALCFSQEKISRDFVFETVNTSIAFPRPNDEIVLLGFGCTEEGGFNRNFGFLVQGRTTVSSLSREDYGYIVTKGGAAVCYGDSGGAAYVNLPGSARRIIGVNSRGDIKTKSYLASTSTKEFIDWAISWSEEKGVMVCGIHPKTENCR